MPDRIMLNAGLLDSDAYNALDLDARDLYIRLLIVADDFGCYDGRENVIATQCYPLGRADALPLDQLHAQGMVMFYSNAGRRYIAITRWRENLRLRRKFPAPPIHNDLPDLKLRVKFGSKGGMNWANPRATDDVSILLDRAWKPVTPQPAEWRRADGSPLASPIVVPTPAVTRVTSDHVVTAGSNVPLVTGASSVPLPLPSTPTNTLTNAADGVAAADLPSTTARSNEDPATATAMQAGEKKGNGAVWVDGRIEGVSEEQRVYWQTMFNDLVISDEIARAGEWLRVNDGEREAVLADGSLSAFVFRWLLRSDNGKKAKRTVGARGAVDA